MEDEFAPAVGIQILVDLLPILLPIALFVGITVLCVYIFFWLKENFRTELSDFWSLSLKPYLKFLGIHKKKGGD